MEEIDYANTKDLGSLEINNNPILSRQNLVNSLELNDYGLPREFLETDSWKRFKVYFLHKASSEEVLKLREDHGGLLTNTIENLLKREGFSILDINLLENNPNLEVDHNNVIWGTYREDSTYETASFENEDLDFNKQDMWLLAPFSSYKKND